ncbi:MAG: hypothetical protein HYZ10_00610 [Ignavibacteriales bacterium]|nr:hypothetical protein [Ignavibacteriales bacterium]
MNNYWNFVYEQNKAKEQLQKISNSRRVPHAFIFSGQEGVGKFNTAIQFAKSINEIISGAINNSLSQRIDELQEPYIKLIMPLPRGKGETSEDSGIEKLPKEVIEDLKSELQKKAKNPYYKIAIENANTIKISSIRDIKKFISLTSYSSGFRFVIILDSEFMNDQAQNALLKSLEEPPLGIIFILLTSQKEKLLPTIVSRCREIIFEPLSKDAVRQILINNFSIESQIAKKVSNFSDGSVTQAIQLIGYDFEAIQQKTISVLRYAFARKYQSALSEILNFSKNQPDDAILFLLKMIKTWLNDVVRHRKSVDELAFEDSRETIEKFNSKFFDSNIEVPFSNLEYLESCFSRNMNLNVLFLNLIFELASVVKRN